jgi:hypothetical protein
MGINHPAQLWPTLTGTVPVSVFLGAIGKDFSIANQSGRQWSGHSQVLASLVSHFLPLEETRHGCAALVPRHSSLSVVSQSTGSLTYRLKFHSMTDYYESGILGCNDCSRVHARTIHQHVNIL